MGEKLDARTEFSYEIPEEGVHIAVVQEPKTGTYDCQGGVKGYSFGVKCVIDGGPSDGLWHFENWRSRWPDGKLNTKALSAMYGFLVKLGVKKLGGIDSDEIEQERFVKGFEGIAGKAVGLDIFHSKGKDNKEWSRAKAYYTVAEAKAKMGVAPVANGKKEAPKAEDKGEGW
uniref:Uncharacterized protein n=1 Tax=viral metagenome TaxID=1070528 RepID=A0A6H1Z9K7_9ZZZZ